MALGRRRLIILTVALLLLLLLRKLWVAVQAPHRRAPAAAAVRIKVVAGPVRFIAFLVPRLPLDTRGACVCGVGVYVHERESVCFCVTCVYIYIYIYIFPS